MSGDVRRPPPILDLAPLASNVPQNTTFWAFWAMSMKPPGPTGTPPSLEALTLPGVELAEAEEGDVEAAAGIESNCVGASIIALALREKPKIWPVSSSPP